MNEDREPTAREWNALYQRLLANRWQDYVTDLDAPPPFPHPYTVTAARFQPPDNYAGPLNPDQTWSLTVSDGFVNDAPASILYQRTGDPRGWKMPDGYVETIGLSNSPGGSPWIERDALDDPDDPPFLIMADPPTAALAALNPAASDWSQIPDSARLSIQQGAFCSESDWDLELWRAHVILSAAPFQSTLVSAKLPPPALVNFRLSTSAALPDSDYGSSAGGWTEVATLYLLRDPADPYDSAQIQILPRLFYDVWAMTLQPGGALSTQGGFVAGVATPEFWTV